ncbi:MAG: Cell envelope-associated transcriptional attenuator LytR-CpsA-Psr, subfamily M [Clostridiales bacterium 38_11]|nr:MAG: Cell envelope-associated transcriptional attenuator LytR-CpsA-Psr, subfamily M [Clostridiales bacterium 38_11]
MGQFIKVFLISLLCFALTIGAGIYTYIRFFNPYDGENYTYVENPAWDKNFNEIEEDDLTPLEKAIRTSKRVNILVMGLEGLRSDTMMVVSFDRATANVNIIAIPRDTYFFREGYEAQGQKKVNAIYSASGAQGVMKVFENILKVPIHNFITIDYEGVRKSVDVIGGVEVDVPFHMEYEDPYDDPPLSINIPEGLQVLNGEKSLEYLRFRHNNDWTVGYPNGDLGRIEAQQKFIKNALKKTLSFRLPVILREIYPYIKTDLNLAEMLLLAGDAVNFSIEKLDTAMIPGYTTMIDGLSYYVHDPRLLGDMIDELYGVE